MNTSKIFSFFILSILFIHSASADLVVSDFLNHNDKLLIQDTSTGLYWLKVNYVASGDSRNYVQALSVNYNSIEARIRDTTDVLYGFRHATVYEVGALLQEAGIPLSSTQNYTPSTFLTLAATQAFIDTFGFTYKSVNGTKVTYQLKGMTSTTCSQVKSNHCTPSIGQYVMVSGVGINGEMNPQGIFAFLLNSAVNPSNYATNTGHFLVTMYNPSKIIQ